MSKNNNLIREYKHQAIEIVLINLDHYGSAQYALEISKPTLKNLFYYYQKQIEKNYLLKNKYDEISFVETQTKLFKTYQKLLNQNQNDWLKLSERSLKKYQIKIQKNITQKIQNLNLQLQK